MTSIKYFPQITKGQESYKCGANPLLLGEIISGGEGGLTHYWSGVRIVF